MTAVDVVVMGLQKRPISAKVVRVGIREFPGSGIVVDEVIGVYTPVFVSAFSLSSSLREL
jgi:hypothetical protein